MQAERPFERILVGVDEGGLAENAVARAVTLAAALDAELELVHVVEIPPPLWPREAAPALHATAIVHARTQLLERLRALDLPWDEVGASRLDDVLTVEAGHPAKVLLKRAQDGLADLIVVGPHERRSVFDFGSTARAILARTEVPVWVQVGAVSPLRNILVAVDFSDTSRAAMEYAHALAARTDASVTVLSAYAPPAFGYAGAADAIPGPTYVIEEERQAVRDALERWMDEFAWGDVRSEPRFVEGDPTGAIVAQGEGFDLVVMGTHGRTGLSRFLVGSVAYGVLKHRDGPVLVVPSTKQTEELGGA